MLLASENGVHRTIMVGDQRTHPRLSAVRDRRSVDAHAHSALHHERPDPGFLPSRYGLRFPNAFPPTPFLRVPGTSIGVGNAADGLCGGMTFMARILFEHRLAPPPDTTPPPDGPLFRDPVGRAIASFDLPSGPAKYEELWMGLPDHASFFGMAGVVWRTLAQEWPAVRADLDAGIVPVRWD